MDIDGAGTEPKDEGGRDEQEALLSDLERQEAEAFAGIGFDYEESGRLIEAPTAGLSEEAGFGPHGQEEVDAFAPSSSEEDAFLSPEERSGGPWLSPAVSPAEVGGLVWSPARLLARGERGEGAAREPWASFMLMGQAAPVELRGREAADLVDASGARPGEALDLSFGSDGKPLGARRPEDALGAERSWIERSAEAGTAPERDKDVGRAAVGGEDLERTPEQVAALGPAEAARMLERSQARAEALLIGARERIFERIWTMERIGERTAGLGEETRGAMKGAMGKALAAVGIRDHFNEAHLDLGVEGLVGQASAMRRRLKLSAASRDSGVNEVAEMAMRRIHHGEETREAISARSPSEGVGRKAAEGAALSGEAARDAEEQWFQSRREQWRDEHDVASRNPNQDFEEVHGKIADAAVKLAVNSIRNGDGAYFNALFYNELEIPGLKLNEEATGLDASERRAALMADLLTVARAGQIEEDIQRMEQARARLGVSGAVSSESAELACSSARAYDAAGRAEAESVARFKKGVDDSRDLRGLLGQARGRSEGYSAALDAMEDGLCADVGGGRERVARAIGERAAAAVSREFGADPAAAKAPLSSAKPSRSRSLSVAERLARGQAGLDRAEALIAESGHSPAAAAKAALAGKGAGLTAPSPVPAAGISEKLASMRGESSGSAGSVDKDRERALKAAREAMAALARSGKGAAPEADRNKAQDNAQGMGR